MSEDFYRAFEDRFRGTRETIKSRLRAYLPFVEPLRGVYAAAPAVDLGCGRGEWLELLQAAGFDAQGVDLDDGMLETCRELKLAVQTGDALTFLKSLPDASQVVVSGFHLAEHIAFDDLQVLVQDALRVLKPGGLLILETPNPENIVVGSSSFYQDPTHRRPIPPQLLSFLPEHYGFEKVKILRLQESVDLSCGKILTLLDILNGVSPDYAVVARKGGEAAFLDATNPAFEAIYGLTLESAAIRYDQQADARARQAEAVYRWLENEWNAAKARIETLAVQLGIAENENGRIKGELIEYQQSVHEASAALNSERERTQWLENEWNAAKTKINELNQSSHHWWTVADDFDRKLQAMYASASWRITKPVRLLHAGLCRIVKVISLILKPPLAQTQIILKHEVVADLSQLTPHARQMYTELKATIAHRPKDHS